MTDPTKWWTYGRDDGRSPQAPQPFFTFVQAPGGGLTLQGLGDPIGPLGQSEPAKKVATTFFIGAASTLALTVLGAVIGSALGKASNRSAAWGLVGALAGSASGTLGTFGAVAYAAKG